MDHHLATTSRAVERYILGEMHPEERDAFEEHYFSCDACADDVRATSIFVENAKAVLSEPSEPWPLRQAQPGASPSRGGWFAWLRPQAVFGLVAAALLGVVGFETATISSLREPRLTAASVLHGESRGAVPVIGQGQPLALLIALEEPPQGAEVTAELRSESGAVLQKVTAKAPPPDTGLNLYIPDPKLKPGRYAVVIGTAKYPFEVR